MGYTSPVQFIQEKSQTMPSLKNRLSKNATLSRTIKLWLNGWDLREAVSGGIED